MPKRGQPYFKGLQGEDLACEYLQKKGMVLLKRRYRSLYGEIDLIVEDGDTLVFVEVKTRSHGGEGAGLLSITPLKQKRLAITASLYMAEQDTNQPVRFDAVEITKKGILHIENAFDVPEF